MSEEKKISEWEKELGIIFCEEQEDEKVSLEDFRAIAQEQAYIFVNYKDRLKFLKENNYEASRENILNTELSSVKKEAVQEEGES